jgi:hypothetical protein
MHSGSRLDLMPSLFFPSETGRLRDSPTVRSASGPTHRAATPVTLFMSDVPDHACTIQLRSRSFQHFESSIGSQVLSMNRSCPGICEGERLGRDFPTSPPGFIPASREDESARHPMTIRASASDLRARRLSENTIHGPFCHPREGGDPGHQATHLGSRLRGNDVHTV